MRRRDFIVALGSAVASWPTGAQAQTAARMRKLGVLLLSKQDQAIIKPFVEGLTALGYVDGKTIGIEYRDGDGNHERLAEAADQLVRLSPDVIFAFGGDVAPFIKKATAKIPTVVVVSNDPVESGPVASLGRPG